MKPTILINEASIASLTEATFTVSREMVPCSVFCNGLGVGETLAINFLSNDVSEDDAQATDWTALTEAGDAAVIDADNTMRVLNGPGVYKMSISAAASAIRAGIY